jgi:hypothetical protein
MMPHRVPGGNTMRAWPDWRADEKRLESANVPVEQAAAMVRSQLGLPPPESSRRSQPAADRGRPGFMNRS